MRRLVLPMLLASALAACSAPAPPPNEAATTPPPAAAGGPAPASASTAAKPAETATTKEVPEGACGDQAKVAADQRLANTARWSTASEQNNFGFDVYRGDSEKGAFAKLTRDAILGAGTSDETHKYEYRDDTIDPCREYWYYVESINTNGTREKFTPTFRAPPKRRAAGGAAAGEAGATPVPKG